MDFETCMTLDVEQLTAAFIKIRQHCADRFTEVDNQLKPLKEQMEIFRAALMAKLHEAGANSMKCGSGTPYISTKSNWKVVDWDAFYQFVQDTQETEFLVKNVAGTIADAWLEKTGNMPPGLELKRVETLNVRT